MKRRMGKEHVMASVAYLIVKGTEERDVIE
jgi:hypothetical protein